LYHDSTRDRMVVGFTHSYVHNYQQSVISEFLLNMLTDNE